MKKLTLLLVGFTITSTAQLHSTSDLQSWINYFSAQAHTGYQYIASIDWNTHSKNINTQVQKAYAQLPSQAEIAQTMQENPQATAATGFFATIIGLRGLQNYWNAQRIARKEFENSLNELNLKDEIKQNIKKQSDAFNAAAIYFKQQKKQNQLQQLQNLQELKDLGRNRTISNFQTANAQKLKGVRQFMNDAEDNGTPITYQQIISPFWVCRADKIQDYTSDKFENYKVFIDSLKKN
ncbi:MAG: hypothetical protein ACXWL5_04135 [Candidatus Chromulinivorax sp.]